MKLNDLCTFTVIGKEKLQKMLKQIPWNRLSSKLILQNCCKTVSLLILFPVLSVCSSLVISVR